MNYMCPKETGCKVAGPNSVVHEHNDGFYYRTDYDELVGPFETGREANDAALIHYLAPVVCPSCGGTHFCVDEGHIICTEPGGCTWMVSIEDAAARASGVIPDED